MPEFGRMEGRMPKRAALLNRPLHPILAGLPMSLSMATVMGYVLYAIQADPFWFRVGYVANLGAVLLAAGCALPGLVNWMTPVRMETPTQRTAPVQMLLNGGVLGLFAASAVAVYSGWSSTAPVLGWALPLTGLGLLALFARLCSGDQRGQGREDGMELAPGPERRTVQDGNYQPARDSL